MHKKFTKKIYSYDKNQNLFSASWLHFSIQNEKNQSAIFKNKNMQMLLEHL